MATSDAGEFGLRATVLFRHKATATTLPAAVAWIDKHHGDTRKLGFVRHELSQLTEAPIVLSRSLPFANRHPGANVRQIFEHDRGLRVFGKLNKLFGDAMVDAALKTRLLTRHLFESALGTFGASRLVGLACRMATFANGFNFIPGILECHRGL